ncbi:MAG TPA: cation diffusion facilitator family transporter [Trueperaceae bacterium]
MAHDHPHAPTSHGQAFALGISLNLGYVVLEVLFGLWAGSLALLADAGHNASDVLSLLLAWGAGALARRRPAGRFTYGFKRSPILASLFNALLLLVAMGAIAWEAIHRLGGPDAVEAGTVVWVAVAGVLVNGVTALLFLRGGREDLNIRGAFLHMAADTGVTAGVLVAGLIMLWTTWAWLDPAISLLVVLVVLASTWGLLRDSLHLALDAVPAGIDLEGVRSYLAGIPGVSEVHDLHVWPLSTTETALTAHLVYPAGVDEPDRLLGRICQELHHRFGIGHSTLQLETGSGADPCRLADPHTV